jgi:hypothetical protein
VTVASKLLSNALEASVTITLLPGTYANPGSTNTQLEPSKIGRGINSPETLIVKYLSPGAPVAP